jgi:hypothetical protein
MGSNSPLPDSYQPVAQPFPLGGRDVRFRRAWQRLLGFSQRFELVFSTDMGFKSHCRMQVSAHLCVRQIESSHCELMIRRFESDLKVTKKNKDSPTDNSVVTQSANCGTICYKSLANCPVEKQQKKQQTATVRTIVSSIYPSLYPLSIYLSTYLSIHLLSTFLLPFLSASEHPFKHPLPKALTNI